MIKKSILFVSLIFIGVLILLGCNTQKISGGWNDLPMTIDGKRTEWDNQPTLYFEESDVLLGLSNDDKNVYFIFCFKDSRWARAISMEGVTLWLDGRGKENKDFGIKYRGQPPLSEIPKSEFAGRTPGGNMPDLREDMEPIPEQFTVVRSENNFIIPIGGDSGPAVGFHKAKDIYTYEFSVPLKASELGRYGIGIQPGEEMALGIEWGMDLQMMRPEKSERGGMGGGKGGMGGGGGRGGMGGGRGGMGGMRPQMEMPPGKQEIWLKVRLATDSTSVSNLRAGQN